MAGKFDNYTIKRLLDLFSGNRQALIQYLEKRPEEKDALWRLRRYTAKDIADETREDATWEGLNRIVATRKKVEARLETLKGRRDARREDEWATWDKPHALLAFLAEHLGFEILDSKKIAVIESKIEIIEEALESKKFPPKKRELLDQKLEQWNNKLEELFSIGRDVYCLEGGDGGIGGNDLEYFNLTWTNEEWAICDEADADDVAIEREKDLLDDIGVEGVSEWAVEKCIDGDEVARDFEDGERNNIWDNPEDFLDSQEDRALSDDQEQEINEKEEAIENLRNEQNELNTEVPEEEQRWEEIDSEIEDLESEIEDIRSNPDGDWDEDKLEEVLEQKMDEIRDDPLDWLKGLGYDKETINRYVDMDELAKLIVETDGRGHIISGYDGNEHEFKYKGDDYCIYRIN